MADNSLVTPQVFTLPRAIESRTQDKQQISGRFIPVTVTKVKGEGQITVKAEMVANGPYTIPQMTIPGAYSQWNRPAIVAGDKGFVLQPDYYIGGQSDLGGGTAGFHYTANLTNSVFIPVSSTKWSKRDMNSNFISGPMGVILQDKDGNGIVQIDTTNKKIIVNPKSGWTCFLGGDGSTGTYDFVMTASGPSINVKARIG